MNEIEVKSHGLFPIVYGDELTAEERAEFDYLEPHVLDTAWFFRFRDHVYDIGEFLRISQDAEAEPFKGWEASHADSFFSGMLIRIKHDEMDDPHVEVAEYFVKG